MFVPVTQVSANFIQHSPHLLNLVAQLFHFIPSIVIMVFLIPVLFLVLFIDASFNFLCQVMESGGMQVLDCGHGMVDSFVRMFAMAFIVMSFNLLPQVPLYTVCFFMPSLFV